MVVQSHWFPVWNINCRRCSEQLVARVTSNSKGKKVKAELHCRYCDDIQLQDWILGPANDGAYLLDQEPVDLSGVG